MKIFHPIPPSWLDAAQALQEHEHIIRIHDMIVTGKLGHPEAQRWANHLPALYRRYHDVLSHLNLKLRMNVADQLIHEPLIDGAEIIYPSIPENEVWEMWDALMVSATAMEYGGEK